VSDLSAAHPTAAPAGADHLRLLADSLTDHALIELDREGLVRSWPAAAERLTGHPAEEMMGQPASALLAGAASTRALQQAAAQGRFADEGPRLRKDGRPFRASVVVSPIREGDQLLGFALVAREVTTLPPGEALLQSVLDCVVETVSVFDPEGELILANPAYVAMTGKAFAAGTAAGERLMHYGLFSSDGARPLTWDELPAIRALRGETVADLEVMIRSPVHPDGAVMSTNARCLTQTSMRTPSARK
jgi:PAS domain S-box-containing protein